MSLIKGIHHVSLTCCGEEEYKRTIDFYKEVLGIPVVRTFQRGTMFETGSGLIEVFNDGEKALPQGTVRHFALDAADVDACVKAVTEAGYEVLVQPKDIEILSEPVFPARIAFCRGPLGEEIEFFCEK